ncbi:hypothetical protein AB835_13030 [Candidatus Endobugula sertula]|uniref:Uncharacterized protein n=1 Tax=Candidatus Endobugula sertula TaxID=62101 RepID=A0A1D2QM57_9GAMM|nr:hypothetical protein AB835_13030 [Candidatus Endobugula sertula]
MENLNTLLSQMNEQERDNLLNDMNDFIQEINGQLANASSRIVDKLTDRSLTSNIYEQADRMSDIADGYAAEFHQYAEAAERYAERAIDRDSKEGRRAWEATAQQFNDWVGSRATQSADSRLDSKRLSVVGNLGKYAGPVGDIIDVGKVIGDALTGNWDGVGQTSSSILGGIADTEAGVTLLGFVFPYTSSC